MTAGWANDDDDDDDRYYEDALPGLLHPHPSMSISLFLPHMHVDSGA